MKPRVRTYTGKEVNPLDLRPEDIDIRDIAHSLALCNRFAGHTRLPVSVAQHSILVAQLAEPFGQALAGLLHDATEAYLGDVTKWLKATMPEYIAAEERAADVIAAKFGLPPDAFATPEVDWADRVMVRFEGAHNLGCGPGFVIEHPNYPPLTETEIEAVNAVTRWHPWRWQEAERLFQMAFDALTFSGATVASVVANYW